MGNIKTRYIAISFFLCIFAAGILAEFALNTDFGNLEVRSVIITNRNQQISGLLYRPINAGNQDPAPAIVLVHGISGNKQMMKALALELAKNGFVALAIDAVGHGNSGGQLAGTDDLSLGVLAAVHYLESQPFVNASSIGLIGHSLGGGAIRAAAATHGNISGLVFIAGGLGAMVTDPAYGELNSTFPRNLLIAVGKYDTLFDLTQLQTETLLPVFGTSESVSSDRMYGDFIKQNARKLITPETTHFFEPFDPAVVSETVLWMRQALMSGRAVQQRTMTYIYVQITAAVVLVSFFGFILSVFHLIFSRGYESLQERSSRNEYGELGDWKTLFVWSGLSVFLYVPMSFVGFLIPFPPLIFGASIAWWLLTVGVAGLLFAVFLAPRISTVKLNVRKVVSDSFSRKGIGLAAILFAFAYVIVSLMETFLTVNVGILVPFFKILNPLTRLLMFALFLPFYLFFFFVDGLYLLELRKRHVQAQGVLSGTAQLVKVSAVKIAPYVAVVTLQYVPLALFGVQVFPGFVGLLVEFFWFVIPVFLISTVCSWWFCRTTGKLSVGVVFNSLLFAWVSAGIFPF